MTVATTGNATSQNIISAAVSQLGVKYVWGGEKVGQGFDCSGLTQWAYSTVGINIPRTSEAQYAAVTPVAAAQAEPGMLVFSNWGEQGPGPGHVGIYLGNGKYIDAPHTGATIGITSVPGDAQFGAPNGVTWNQNAGDATTLAASTASDSGGTGCNAKGKIFGILSWQLTYCEAKAVVGGITVGMGGAVALLGVAIIIAWGIGHTSAGKAARGALGGPAKLATLVAK